MIAWLQGVVLDKAPPLVVVNVQGLGYEVHVSMTTLFDVPEPGDELALYIHHVIREDASLLFGFSSQHERRLFQTMIKINGVGPKLALGILSSVSPTEFIQLILSNDLKRLVKLPGIGKKTAERLLVELKDKLELSYADEGQLPSTSSSASLATNTASQQSEAIEALISLGYKENQALSMVKGVWQAGMSTEQLVRLVLQGAMA